LRLDVEGKNSLTGDSARTFFTLPAVLEVYLTERLSQEEFGCYHFHLGDLQHQGIAIGVFLVGYRYEGKGAVLRFQAATYSEIYDVLPDLLAPFALARAVDWKKSLASIPAGERSDAIMALIKREVGRPRGRY